MINGRCASSRFRPAPVTGIPSSCSRASDARMASSPYVTLLAHPTPAKPASFRASPRDGTGVEAFAGRVESHLMGGVCGRRVSEQALEVGEDHIGLAQLFGHPPERDRRIGHRLEIN